MNGLQDPPKWALKFLRLYAGDRRLEEIEGDLFELYNEYLTEKGTRRAKLFYWWLVIRNIRTYAFKNSQMDNRRLATFLMFFNHHLKVSWRDLLKHKTASFINILGLSMGLASFILIYRIVTSELSFNTHLSEKDKIFRIYTEFHGLNGSSFTNSGVANPIPDYFQQELKGVQELAHFHTFETSVSIPRKDRLVEVDYENAILLADSSYFQIFDQYEWLTGSRDQSLKEPFQLVLTEDQAAQYFPLLELDEIVGQSVIYQDSLKTIVSGIVRQSDHLTDLNFTEMISFSTIETSWLDERYGTGKWDNTSSHSQLWIKTVNPAMLEGINAQLVTLTDSINNKSPDDAWKRRFLTQSINDLHFNTQVGIFDSSPDPVHLETLRILSVVAVLLLLIAVFNFINLETAQANTKLKEVGIRKVIGSTRRLLLARFLFNSMIITAISMLLAIVLAHQGISVFSDFVPEYLTLGLDQWDFWAFLLGTGFMVGLIAGLYPAVLISAPAVSSALKQGLSGKGSSQRSYLRKGLIVFQFIFSQMLIMGTLVVMTQIKFMLNKDLGFDQEGIAYLWIPWHTPDDKIPILKNKLDGVPEIMQLSFHDSTPARGGWSTTTLSHFRDSVESKHRAHSRKGDTHYFDVYGIDILAGRNAVAREDGQEALINERFRKDLGYTTNEEAVGIRLGDDYIVVGVTSDFHTQSLHFAVEPTIFRYSEKENYVGMKIAPQQDLTHTIGKLSEAWEEVFPDEPFELKFLDDAMQRLYNSEQKTSKLASFATAMAIFISGLGLFGLISFTTLQRTKEIGIRKVLGASVMQIGNVISREFLVLIGLALIISIPLSYYYTHQWLENFSFRIAMTWWIYVVGGVASLLVAFLSVGFKIWQASTANPVESLRYE